MASRNPNSIADAIGARRTIAEPRPSSRARARAPRGDQAEPELPMLPSDCPIEPLGVRGQRYFFLDELNQLIELPAREVNQTGITALLGRQTLQAKYMWPRYGAPDKETGQPKINGVEWDRARQVLMACAAQEGVFDPIGKVRGRGAHLGEDGELILHCGSKVWIGPVPDQDRDPDYREYHHPGLVGGKVYPTGADVQRPATRKAGEQADREAVRRAIGMLSCWNWARPLIDPILMLGWTGAARLGGALRWRSHVWVTGDSATGKSTLQEWIEHGFGGALLQSTDATEAGIRQVLGYDTLPVALDELEAEEDNRRANAVIKLARTASSGGRGVRGGQDHQGHEFTARSCFLFSSILLPPMLDQDRNRLAILELHTLPKGAKPPVLEPRAIEADGRAMLRILAEGWPRWRGVWDAMIAALAKVGHGGRSGYQFGTLLAAAYILMEEDDDELEEVAADWARQLDARTLAEKAGEMSNAERCARHLASSILPPIGGEVPASIASWIIKALTSIETDKIKHRMGTHGLRVVRRYNDGTSEDPLWKHSDPPMLAHAVHDELYLAVACSSRGLDPLFRDSLWSSRAGASSGWSQALGRIAGAVKGAKIRVGAEKIAVTLVPLRAIADLDQDDVGAAPVPGEAE